MTCSWWTIYVASLAKFMVILRFCLKEGFKFFPVSLEEGSPGNDSWVSTGSKKKKELHCDETDKEYDGQRRGYFPIGSDYKYRERNEYC